MLRSSSFHNDVVSFAPSAPLRRPRPLAIAAFIAAVVASGAIITQIAPSHAPTAYDSQPFGHIPH